MNTNIFWNHQPSQKKLLKEDKQIWSTPNAISQDILRNVIIDNLNKKLKEKKRVQRTEFWHRLVEVLEINLVTRVVGEK
jgi:hypothetical protein